MSGNGSKLIPHEPARRSRRDGFVLLPIVILIFASLGTVVAIWLPQRPVRIALTVLNAVIVVALLAILIRWRR